MRRHTYVLPLAVFVIGKGSVFCEVETDAEGKLDILSLAVKLDTPGVQHAMPPPFFDAQIVIDCRSVARKRSRISLLCVFCKPLNGKWRRDYDAGNVNDILPPSC